MYKKVIADTNFLLNCAFIENSLSHQLSGLLKDAGISVIAHSLVVEECFDVLSDRSQSHAFLKKDAQEHLEVYIRKNFELSTSEPIYGDYGISGFDGTIAGIGIATKHPLITLDIELQTKLHAAGIDFVSPLEVWEQFSGFQLFFGTQFGDLRGMIFCRFSSTELLDDSGRIAKLTIFDLEGLGHLYFDVSSSAFCFRKETGETLRVKSQGQRSERAFVMLSWENGCLTLRTSFSDHPSKINLTSPMFDRLENIYFGNDRQRLNYLNGELRCIIYDDRAAPKSLWDSIKSAPPNTMPNVFDADRLNAALVLKFPNGYKPRE